MQILRKFLRVGVSFTRLNLGSQLSFQARRIDTYTSSTTASSLRDCVHLTIIADLQRLGFRSDAALCEERSICFCRSLFRALSSSFIREELLRFGFECAQCRKLFDLSGSLHSSAFIRHEARCSAYFVGPRFRMPCCSALSSSTRRVGRLPRRPKPFMIFAMSLLTTNSKIDHPRIARSFADAKVFPRGRVEHFCEFARRERVRIHARNQQALQTVCKVRHWFDRIAVPVPVRDVVLGRRTCFCFFAFSLRRIRTHTHIGFSRWRRSCGVVFCFSLCFSTCLVSG